MYSEGVAGGVQVFRLRLLWDLPAHRLEFAAMVYRVPVVYESSCSIALGKWLMWKSSFVVRERRISLTDPLVESLTVNHFILNLLIVIVASMTS